MSLNKAFRVQNKSRFPFNSQMQRNSHGRASSSHMGAGLFPPFCTLCREKAISLLTNATYGCVQTVLQCPDQLDSQWMPPVVPGGPLWRLHFYRKRMHDLQVCPTGPILLRRTFRCLGKDETLLIPCHMFTFHSTHLYKWPVWVFFETWAPLILTTIQNQVIKGLEAGLFFSASALSSWPFVWTGIFN